MVHVYQVYSTTGGEVETGAGVVETTSDMIAVATGSVPSGQVSGGMTYVKPSEQQIPPGGMQAKAPDSVSKTCYGILS